MSYSRYSSQAKSHRLLPGVVKPFQREYRMQLLGNAASEPQEDPPDAVSGIRRDLDDALHGSSWLRG